MVERLLLGSRRQLPRSPTQRANQTPQKGQSGRATATASRLARLDIDGECSRPTSWPHDRASIRRAISTRHLHLSLSPCLSLLLRLEASVHAIAWPRERRLAGGQETWTCHGPPGPFHIQTPECRLSCMPRHLREPRVRGTWVTGDREGS